MFQSRSSSYGFTNDPDQLLNVFKAKRDGKHTQNLSKVLTKYNEGLNNNYLREALDYLEQNLVSYFRSEREFMDRVIVCYEKHTAPKLRSNNGIITFYNSMDDETKKKRGVDRNNGKDIVKTHVDQENEKHKQNLEALVKEEQK